MLDHLTTALADRYRIIRELGAGGMATVYLAEDPKHGREVALKVLRPELAATMGPDRFFREIQVAARLQHPHVLPLHDSGEADGFLYFVMPYVTGESLRDRLTRLGELPIADVVRIGSQVADAISYAHSQGVVHRDIKPDNVMLTGRHALVMDFGVAKAVSEAAGKNAVTTAGVALGTPTYMAPEQATADPMLDHRVDIYAIGVMLYEMLTGRPPFDGLAPAQMLVAHVTETPQPVRTRREACPPELEAVVMRCLAKRPADRFQSADDVLHALEPLSASSGGITPTQTRPATAVEAAVPAPRSNSRLVLGFSAVAIAAAALAWGLRGGDAPVPEIPLSSLQNIKVTASGNARAGALAPDGNRVAFFERRCDDAGACAIDLRVHDVGGAGSTTLLAALELYEGIEWSPDSRWIVFNGTYGGRYGSYALPSLGGTPRFLGVGTAAFTGRGDTVIVTAPVPGDIARRQLRWTTASGTSVHREFLYEAGVLDAPGFTRQLRHDRLIGTEFRAGRLRGWLLDGEGRRIDAPPLENLALMLTLPFGSADGVWIGTEPNPNARRLDLAHYRWDSRGRLSARPTAVIRDVPVTAGFSITPSGMMMGGDGSREYSVWAVERDGAAPSAARLRRIGQSTALLWGGITPDGSRLILARARPNDPRTFEFSVAPFAGGQERVLASLQDVTDWDPLPDSRGLLVVQRIDGVQRRSILDLTSGGITALGEAGPEDRAHETLPGGGFAYVPSGVAKVIAIRDVPGRADTTFAVQGDPGVPFQLAASPDGRHLALAAFLVSADSVSVATLDLSTGVIETRATFRGEGSAGLDWLPDGTLLVQLVESEVTNAWWLVVPARGGPARRLGVAPRSDGSFRFSADGKRGIYREIVVRSDIEVWRGLPANGVP